MKWKRAITAEQAALTAVGLDSKLPLRVEIESATRCFEQRAGVETSKADALLNTIINDPIGDYHQLVFEARDIYEALIQEIVFSDGCDRGELDFSSVLKIALRYQHSEEIDYLDPERTQVSKESLAQWFYEMGDLDKAKKILPSFRGPDMNNETSRARLNSVYSEYEAEINTLKSENTALKSELVKLKALREVSGDSSEGGKNDLSKFLPVAGEDLQILSRAFQNFPTRFEYYKTQTYTKKRVMEWLGESYKCNDRKQHVFSDILKQNFDLKDVK